MKLAEHEIDNLNILASWLAGNDVSCTDTLQADMAILAGHAILPNIEGAFEYVARTGMFMLLSGGIGHSTVLLKDALSTSPRYGTIQITPESEAGMLAEVAVQAFGIDREKLLIEDRSRNCGENAAFSLKTLQKRRIFPERIVLIQDPLMQRRTTATFEHEWRKAGFKTHFISWPVFIPQLVLEGGKPVIKGANNPSKLWTPERYVSMIMGEVRRLRDAPDGYGPQGTGFISHIDIPHNVEKSWQSLMSNAEFASAIR
ncbi:YdcF family protein [Sodalis sp. RH21]|uniref:YdcF family protein n=1 Tax=unclassified Sodalis (in: enterobacteria) TaxID=2636512 RepID=UPI0039B598C1